MKTRLKLLGIDLTLMSIYGVLPLSYFGINCISIGCLFIGLTVHFLLALKYVNKLIEEFEG